MIKRNILTVRASWERLTDNRGKTVYIIKNLMLIFDQIIVNLGLTRKQ